MTKISSLEYSKRRKELLERTKADFIFIVGSGQIQMSADVTYKFCQDGNFYYLTGLNEPDLILCITKNEEFLIKPKISNIQEIFDGSASNNELTKVSDVKVVLDEISGWKVIKRLSYKYKTVHTVKSPSAYIKGQSFYTNPARKNMENKLKRLASLKIVDIRPDLAKMRSIKSKSEIECIEKAVDMTLGALKRLETYNRQNPGKINKENHIEARLTQDFIYNNAEHAYQPIIASGLNACTIHHITNDSDIKEGELVLIDVGAKINGYSADITRTILITGALTSRQKDIIQSVEEVQRFAISLVKPGLTFKEYEMSVRKKMKSELLSLKLFSEPDDIFKYFPHATSHFLGIDIHDSGDYSQPMKENMVITVEPGIYIKSEKIGVRIEDEIVITKNGARVLGKI